MNKRALWCVQSQKVMMLMSTHVMSRGSTPMLVVSVGVDVLSLPSYPRFGYVFPAFFYFRYGSLVISCCDSLLFY